MVVPDGIASTLSTGAACLNVITALAGALGSHNLTV